MKFFLCVLLCFLSPAMFDQNTGGWVIRNLKTGLVMTVTDNDEVDLQPFKNENKQIWHSVCQMVNVGNGKVLDVRSSGSAGDTLIMADKKPYCKSNNQVFMFNSNHSLERPDGRYLVVTVKDDKYYQPGSELNLAKSEGTDDQQFVYMLGS